MTITKLKLKLLAIRALAGLRYLARGDVRSFLGRLRQMLREQRVDGAVLEILPGTPIHWCVMVTPHTRFLGEMLAQRLRAHDWRADVSIGEPDRFEAHFYIVVCAQMFRQLPPPGRRFVYQMEQSVSSRWFNRKYLRVLRASRGVIDYSLSNLDFLQNHRIDYPLTYYLPVGALPLAGTAFADQPKRHGVLFYGDANSSPRRQKMLKALQEHFPVHHCSEVFGDAMHREIRAARLVINLHYYDNALLETPRIQECLSLGVPVVSEDTRNRTEYPELEGAVCFFPEGDIQAMIRAVGETLANPPAPETIEASVARSQTRFHFFLDRLLVSEHLLPPGHLAATPPPIPRPTNGRLVLSVPETIQRRRDYVRHPQVNGQLFDGARYTPGWKGCALSHRVMAQYCLQHSIEMPLIAEDDVALPDDIETRLEVIYDYLRTYDQPWHVFAGLIADLHADARILRADTFRGMQFITIDRMTSMVYNIYSHAGLTLLQDWNPAVGTAETNTIDRYLENQTSLRVIVTLPFVANLREDTESTLWGIGNQRYIQMIEKSQQRLQKKLSAWERQTSAVAH